MIALQEVVALVLSRRVIKDVGVSFYNLETFAGQAEAAWYGIGDDAPAMVVEQDGEVTACWKGDLPDLRSLASWFANMN